MSDEVKKSIVDWLYTQQYWVQIAASKILNKEELSENALSELLICLKSDEGAKTGKLVDFTSLSSTISNGLILKIESIGDIRGIDDLSPKTPLDFGTNLTVVYGHNGSGKSGYTRILKKACGKPDAITLIPNVFKASPTEQICSISFNVNGTISTVKWIANSSPIATLRGVDIFDSAMGGSYIEEENEASYLPIEVALFEKLVNVFDALKIKLEKSQSSLPSKLPKRPTEYGNSKYIEAMFTRLKAETAPETLKNFYEYTDADEKSIESLEEREDSACHACKSKTTKKGTIASPSRFYN